MLPLDKRRAMEMVMSADYRVAFRKADDRGVVEFVRDVRATSMVHAIQQAEWQLHDAHREDHAAYRCVRAVELERGEIERGEIEGAPI